MVTITPMAEQKIKELMQEEKDTVGFGSTCVVADAMGINMAWRSRRRSAKTIASLKKAVSK